MKKVFMPSMDELYQMQEYNVNIYKYILVKAIESLICNGLNYPSKGIFANAPKYLRENPDIARAVCVMYPDEMLFSEYARNDIDLAIKLMDYKEYKENGLDYLCRFDNSVLSNTLVLTSSIIKLEKEITNNPKYRFEYISSELNYLNKGCGKLIDAILNCEISNNDLILMQNNIKETIIKTLVNIEPIYALRFDGKQFNNSSTWNEETARIILLKKAVNKYADRYGISYSVGNEYYGKDILTNPDQNVKRLLKCINDRNK